MGMMAVLKQQSAATSLVATRFSSGSQLRIWKITAFSRCALFFAPEKFFHPGTLLYLGSQMNVMP